MNPEQAKEIKRLYEKESKPRKVLDPAPQSSGGSSSGIGAFKHICKEVKVRADKLFARMIFMCCLPFLLVRKPELSCFLKDGLGVIYQPPCYERLSGVLLDGEFALVSKDVEDLLGSMEFVQLSSDG